MRILLFSIALLFSAQSAAHGPSGHGVPSTKGAVSGPVPAGSAPAGSPQPRQMQPAGGQPFCVTNSLGKVNCVYLPGSKH